MRAASIQQAGKSFGCLTAGSVVIGVVYLAGAIFSLFFGTREWAIRGLKISAVLIGIPVVLWAVLFAFVRRSVSRQDDHQPQERVAPPRAPAQGRDAFREINADIEFEENAPYVEAKYDAVLPVFSDVFLECEDHGKSVQDFIRFFVGVYGTGVVPYLTRFVAESGAADRLRNEKSQKEN